MTTTDIVNHVKFSAVFAFIAFGFMFPKATRFVCRRGQSAAARPR